MVKTSKTTSSSSPLSTWSRASYYYILHLDHYSVERHT